MPRSFALAVVAAGLLAAQTPASLAQLETQARQRLAARDLAGALSDYQELARQAQIVALTETFAIITLSVIAMLPLLVFLRGKLPRRGPPVVSE